MVAIDGLLCCHGGDFVQFGLIVFLGFFEELVTVTDVGEFFHDLDKQVSIIGIFFIVHWE